MWTRPRRTKKAVEGRFQHTISGHTRYLDSSKLCRLYSESGCGCNATPELRKGCSLNHRPRSQARWICNGSTRRLRNRWFRQERGFRERHLSSPLPTWFKGNTNLVHQSPQTPSTRFLLVKKNWIPCFGCVMNHGIHIQHQSYGNEKRPFTLACIRRQC
jgi:hypothetical protein